MAEVKTIKICVKGAVPNRIKDKVIEKTFILVANNMTRAVL